MSGELTKLTRAELQDMIARASYGEGKIKLNLCGYDLTGVDLSYLDLSEARLLHCTLNRVGLYCTDMSGALLEECIIDNLDRDSLERGRNNFNGVRFLYHRGTEALYYSLVSQPLFMKTGADISSLLLSGDSTLSFFEGATVVYWDTEAERYLTHVVSSDVEEEDRDIGGEG
jgi:uncharacterized protein YjbI with pentapeptide repeats